MGNAVQNAQQTYLTEGYDPRRGAQPVGPMARPVVATPALTQPAPPTYEEDKPWWDIPANIIAPAAEWIGEHGGERVGNWLTEWGGDSAIGKAAYALTLPVSLPATMVTKGLTLAGEAFAYANYGSSWLFQAATLDNPLYRDGVDLDDFGKMWEVAQNSMSPGQAFGLFLGQGTRQIKRNNPEMFPGQGGDSGYVDYSNFAPIFDVGFNPYDMTPEQRETLANNAAYGLGTGTADFGWQVLLAIGGDKGARSVSRAAGMTTKIRGVRDLETLKGELVTPNTPANAMAQRLAESTDVGDIMSNPLVRSSTQPEKIGQMLMRVDNLDDVNLILLADRGDAVAIGQIMSSAPSRVYELADISPKLQMRIAEGIESGALTETSTGGFLKSAFNDAIQRDAFYKQALDSFMSYDKRAGQWGTTRNNTFMPRGTTGGRSFFGNIGDAAGRGQMRGADIGRDIASGEGLVRLQESDLWAVRTLGRVGSTAPVTRLLQWTGGRRPMGLVSTSTLRPGDVRKELKAYIDSASFTTGKQEFSFLSAGSGEVQQMSGAAYRTYVEARVAEAIASNSDTMLAGVVRDVEAELLSALQLRRGVDKTKVDAAVRAIQRKRDSDIGSIEKDGYYYDTDAAQIMVDPLFVRQLADSIHLVPLRETDAMLAGRSSALYWGQSADEAYNAIQKVWRTGILFKPAYTLKNSIAEPVFATILAHGGIVMPDGIATTMANVATNTGHRAMQIATKSVDMTTGAIARIPGARALVRNTYAARQQRLSQLAADYTTKKELLGVLDAEIDGPATIKSPAWERQFGEQVSAQKAAVTRELNDIQSEMDDLLVTGRHNLVDPSEVYTPPTYDELVRRWRTLDEVLSDDPALARAKLEAAANDIITKGTKRAERLAAREDAKHAALVDSLRTSSGNVQRVREHRLEAYISDLHDQIERTAERLARYEAAEAKGAGKRVKPEKPFGYQRVRAQWPVVAEREAGLVGEARAQLDALRSHMDDMTTLYDDMRAGRAPQAAVDRRLADALDNPPRVREVEPLTPAEMQALEQYEAMIARLDALDVHTVNGRPLRAELQEKMASAQATLHEMRDALNQQGDTFISREATEAAMEAISKEFTGLQALSAKQAASREQWRSRVLSGTKPIVYEQGADGGLTELRWGRRREADRIGAQWKANEQARIEGRTQDIVPIDARYVVSPGLFDESFYGTAYRADFGATVTQRAALDPMGTFTDSLSQRIVRAGGAEAIDATDPLYWDELAHFLNRNVRQDEVGQMILEGADVVRVSAFLNTPAGKAYMHKMGWGHDSALSQAQQMHDVIHSHFPARPLPAEVIKKYDLGDNATLQTLVAEREMGAGELRQIMAEYPDLSPVASGRPEFLTGRSVDRALDNIWKLIATHPEERVGRFPGGQTFYKQALKEDIEFAVAQNGGKGLTASEINALRHNAAARALGEVEKTYYNIRRYSHPVYALRYITAFPGALYNSIYRTTRLGIRRPGTYGFMADTITNDVLAFAVDANGDTTDSFDKAKAVVFNVPSFAKGFVPEGDQISIGLQSLDFVRPTPSFAWTVTVPVDSILAAKPDIDQWLREALDETTYNTLFPFGEPTAKGKFEYGGVVLDSMIPSHLRDAVTLATGPESNERFQTTVKQYVQALMAEYEAGGMQGDPPTLKQAIDLAKQHWQAEWTIKFGVFGGFNLQPEGELERKAWRDLSDKYPGDYERALSEFLAQFGTGSEWFAKSVSGRKGGVPPTVLGWQRMESNSGLIARIMEDVDATDPSILAALFADDTTQFDKAVYNAQSHTTIPGTNITIGEQSDPLAWKQDTEASLSWEVYSAAKAKRDAVMAQYGYASLQSNEAAWLKASWDEWVNDFANQPENQAWRTEYDKRDSGRASRTLRVMDIITRDQGFMAQQADNPYFQAMDYYMDEFVRAYQAYASAPDSESRSAIADSWGSFVDQNISPTSAEFAKFYERYLDGNDLEGAGL